MTVVWFRVIQGGNFGAWGAGLRLIECLSIFASGWITFLWLRRVKCWTGYGVGFMGIYWRHKGCSLFCYGCLCYFETVDHVTHPHWHTKGLKSSWPAHLKLIPANDLFPISSLIFSSPTIFSLYRLPNNTHMPKKASKTRPTPLLQTLPCFLWTLPPLQGQIFTFW